MCEGIWRPWRPGDWGAIDPSDPHPLRQHLPMGGLFGCKQADKQANKQVVRISSKISYFKESVLSVLMFDLIGS